MWVLAFGAWPGKTRERGTLKKSRIWNDYPLNVFNSALIFLKPNFRKPTNICVIPNLIAVDCAQSGNILYWLYMVRSVSSSFVDIILTIFSDQIQHKSFIFSSSLLRTFIETKTFCPNFILKLQFHMQLFFPCSILTFKIKVLNKIQQIECNLTIQVKSTSFRVKLLKS